jgi:hypothetical protein
MALIDPASWSERLRQTLACYDEPLLRQVAAKLYRPRSQWPVDELIDRCVQTLDNAPVLDRRLQDLELPARQLLACIGHSRQPTWSVGNLVELVVMLGHADGLAAVRQLLEAGLLYPQLEVSTATPGQATPRSSSRIKSFDLWLGQGQAKAFAPASVSARAIGTDLSLPACPAAAELGESAAAHEADGLEWLLRLAVLWQQVTAGALRRTQQRDFFKRDLERLRDDPLLAGAPAISLGEGPDPGLFIVALALSEGLLEESAGELRAARAFPPAWDQGLWSALASLWAALPTLEGWNAASGWQPNADPGNPYPSANLLALLMLHTLSKHAWADPDAVETWIKARHPFWAGSASTSAEVGVATFLRGLAFQLRLVQAAKGDDGTWLVRLAPVGRWVLGLGLAPPLPAGFSQSLLVQPNLEILAYRQGLTPELIVRLTRFASWKSLGAACTLQLQPETVYRALEAGESFETLRQALERHGQKALPTAVVDALRTWSDKRERITVYPAGALLEFATPAEMNEVLSRGLPAVRLTDRLAVVPNEEQIDYRHFRLTSTRDYALPAERCVAVEADGVTLSIDVAKSDLLLETELQGFAENLLKPSANGRRLYRLTPATLARGQQNGLSLESLEAWFEKRCGLDLSPAARFLLTASRTPPPQARRHLVLHVADEEIADGLLQWPATKMLIHERLGPTALSVLEANWEPLGEQLRDLGIQIDRAALE